MLYIFDKKKESIYLFYYVQQSNILYLWLFFATNYAEEKTKQYLLF